MRVRRPRIVIRTTRRALGEGFRAGQRRLPRETGGIILGWRDTGLIHVEQLLEVPDPHAHYVNYERSHDAAQRALKAALAQLPPDTLQGYVGEWHTHPVEHPPSKQDRKELRAIARTTGKPVVLMVLAAGGAGRWHPTALTAHGRPLRAIPTRIEELP
ncbi:Mov34/MPN/PAD-1 family protein [Euzebya tangerina]|uniref:Mov34/MPN/PAD-1 family protein n=1 Tax=Euzebya tangerina TaxID=591198 RepID=UPI000E32066A|nr:Mov34/MPN/PAD-1 family protein [Euzebya tangerina]